MSATTVGQEFVRLEVGVNRSRKPVAYGP